MFDLALPILWGLALSADVVSILSFFSSTLSCLSESNRVTAFSTSTRPKLSLFKSRESANSKCLRAQAAASALTRASARRNLMPLQATSEQKIECASHSSCHYCLHFNTNIRGKGPAWRFTYISISRTIWKTVVPVYTANKTWSSIFVIIFLFLWFHFLLKIGFKSMNAGN